MSWLDQLNNVRLKIITGDGNEYTPYWINAKRNIRYNTKGFDYVAVEGTYVERKEKSGTQYPIELYFQGENHLDTANAFEISARDKRPWTIEHPFYGNLKVQPIELSLDNSILNITKITGVVWETIEDRLRDESINIPKQIETLKFNNDTALEETFDAKISTPEASDVVSAGSVVDKIGINYDRLPGTNDASVKLKNYLRSASSAAQEFILEPTRYINQTQALINFPFEIEQNIQQKVIALKNSISNLADTLMGINSTPGQKLMFETLSLGMLTAACLVSVVADYTNRAEVLAVADSLEESYNNINNTFESRQYIPDSDNSIQVDNIYNQTQANLNKVAFDAAQERSVILEKDSNVILLAHRFYGASDDNLDKFIDQNDISINEMLSIKKGRVIKYYV